MSATIAKSGIRVKTTIWYRMESKFMMEYVILFRFFDISTLVGYFNALSHLLEEHLLNYLTHSSGDKVGVHTFPDSNCRKVNVVVWL